MNSQGIEATAAGVIAHYFAHEGRENELEPEEHTRRIARDLAAHGLLVVPHRRVGEHHVVVQRSELMPLRVYEKMRAQGEFGPMPQHMIDIVDPPDLEPGMSKYDGKPRRMWCIKCDRPTTARPDETCACHQHHDGCLCRYWKVVEEKP